VVNIAVMLTYLGFAVATAQYALDSVLSWQSHPTFTGAAGSGALPVQGGVLLAIVLSGLIGWLLPGAGAVVCAVLAHRGANPARVVLASLMGLYAVANLCETAGGAANAGLAPGSTSATWIDAGLSLILFGLALAIGVLLLVPPAQRYFSPGPGRRFARAGDNVLSTHDRP
jgi:hypothetical protein